MKKHTIELLVLLVTLLAAVSANAQGDAKPVAATVKPAVPAVAITATTSPADLARAAFVAQGGDKFKSVTSMVLRGSVDLYAPNSTQSVPGGFIIVTAGDKVRIEIDARPAVAFKQIFDGQQTYSSLPGVEMPPFNKIGMSMLTRYDQPGYTVSAIPDKKKQRGFRIADAEGFTTDFYVDPATGRVMSFMVPLQGHTFGTENKKFKEVDGVLVPSSFTWRMEMPQGAFFAEYNVKEMKLNNPIGDDVFVIPN
ncbi:MAG TPA: hypothetical protein VJU86_13235 [Pyrinomonadaceae bacterium]|nr:hypothetical protein [Pyrinomonadaceae bacterium]